MSKGLIVLQCKSIEISVKMQGENTVSFTNELKTRRLIGQTKKDNEHQKGQTQSALSSVMWLPVKNGQ